jgi:hypothetical protein
MKRYLLDTNILGAYLQGRSGALSLARTWIHNDEAATSIVVYGELTEYLKSFPDFSSHQAALRTLLRKVHPYPLTYASFHASLDAEEVHGVDNGPLRICGRGKDKRFCCEILSGQDKHIHMSPQDSNGRGVSLRLCCEKRVGCPNHKLQALTHSPA